MNQSFSQTELANVTCPACGLICDDVQPKTVNCSKGITFFQQTAGKNQAKIKGNSVSLAQAIDEAVSILKQAKYPLFSGLSTDIEGFRAIYSLAEKTKGSITHMNSASSQRNTRVLQSAGWQTTTLTEVKNRADVILCVGTDIISHNPRFFERFVWVKNSMFTDAYAREIIYLGNKHLDTSCGTSPEGRKPIFLQCADENLAEVIAALHALVLGKTLKVSQVGGISLKELDALATKLKQAKYSVLAWIAKDLDLPNAELTIQQITQTVAVLNQTTRSAGLPLGGSDGDTSVNYANAWLSGLTLSDSTYDAGVGAADAQIFVNSFNAKKLPQSSNVPLIVFGNANSTFEHEPDVFIPIATPGLDCAGTLFRVDSSVALPLKKLRETDLLPLSEIVRQIEEKLT